MGLMATITSPMMARINDAARTLRRPMRSASKPIGNTVAASARVEMLAARARIEPVMLSDLPASTIAVLATAGSMS